MRIVMMGTPDFAVPALERLLEAGHAVCGVFTQPDKPKNRGMKLTPPPLKVCAQSRGLPVFQPASLREPAARETLARLAPELIVAAAYGKLLPQEVLDLPPRGCLNIHSSLLPRYRGAAPIHWAVLNGEEKTGVTIMEMALELDAGDILLAEETPIGPEETAEALQRRLARMGGELIVRAVAAVEAGTAVRTPQDAAQATYAPMLSRELSPMDWSRPARELHNQVRGLTPWPAALTRSINGEPVKVFAACLPGLTTDLPPGAVVRADSRGIDMACGDGGVLRILEVQAQGGRRMSAGDFLRGHPVSPAGC